MNQRSVEPTSLPTVTSIWTTEGLTFSATSTKASPSLRSSAARPGAVVGGRGAGLVAGGGSLGWARSAGETKSAADAAATDARRAAPRVSVETVMVPPTVPLCAVRSGEARPDAAVPAGGPGVGPLVLELDVLEVETVGGCGDPEIAPVA